LIWKPNGKFGRNSFLIIKGLKQECTCVVYSKHYLNLFKGGVEYLAEEMFWNGDSSYEQKRDMMTKLIDEKVLIKIVSKY
jgi:hypothetical protein